MIVRGILKKDEKGFYLECKHKFNGDVNLDLNAEQVNFLDTLINKKIKIEYETISRIGNGQQSTTETL